ncbi:MAG: hypothetical protein UV61_C0006G0098 [Candidatus Gottesmanbacteria bacterium GW2011_GWB1_43_11]|uniref:EamA domain-containing protein n=1 Tax=Candidatus Gottesmanbacteria bacterium GW2011_GWB1_43_11 TaxID=1618446 RepID=A0A0G1CN30_9BACT|nr:MAG: hypothetical protein UV04_C0005G0097 [Candidatus Gottesmanbacteria bacterium GW2011_GWA2_42_16]KKS55717.1 MAG: hypothetical protein UV17_C0008G0068 [Candidatus Gottesmanbacteria bacterium GW2011_GWA1_42_26]KKS81173.1 MAG: hypothetical protein UV55_C0019G0029 [Candidatus Gottesmanbacteria bacterium GW2011_GWC1_43_10]KKS86897.1 MAG: hypothetical protein UV61_C0006G0098 [Candidatus Gottesmanbacteria bacterium GW2011_GWB1_43_11]OGG08244.1 MAG: hypothetical protein A2699_06615 [Candidatus Go
MNWLVLSLISVLMFTILNLLMRVLAVKSENQRAFSFVFNAWGAIFALGFYLLETNKFSVPRPNLLQLLLILAVVCLYGLYERFQFSARKHIDASTLTILYSLAPVVAFTGSIIFLVKRSRFPN